MAEQALDHQYPIGASIDRRALASGLHGTLARLREHEPVSWLPLFNGWMVTSRDLCIEVMRDWETYTVDDPRFSTRQVIGPSMLSLDGRDHGRHRLPFVDPFRSEKVRALLSDWTHRRAAQLVDALKPAGEGDLRAELAGPLAAEVMSQVLDLSDVVVEELLDWYQQIVDAVETVTLGLPVPQSGRESFASLGRAVDRNLSTSRLLTSVSAGGALSSDEITSNVATLLFGGIVTTESAIATLFHHLLVQPELLEEVRSDPDLVGNAVEESMRLEPSAAAVDRYATRTVQLGPARVREGDLVRVSLTAANRDPSVFNDPDRFDPRRENTSLSLTFARGPHACLGIHLARLEGRAALRAVIDRLHGLRAGEVHGPEGLVFRAPPLVSAAWQPV